MHPHDTGLRFKPPQSRLFGRQAPPTGSRARNARLSRDERFSDRRRSPPSASTPVAHPKASHRPSMSPVFKKRSRHTPRPAPGRSNRSTIRFLHPRRQSPLCRPQPPNTPTQPALQPRSNRPKKKKTPQPRGSYQWSVGSVAVVNVGDGLITDVFFFSVFSFFYFSHSILLFLTARDICVHYYFSTITKIRHVWFVQ